MIRKQFYKYMIQRPDSIRLNPTKVKTQKWLFVEWELYFTHNVGDCVTNWVC